MTSVCPAAGTGVFLLGGVAAAHYLLPFRGVRGWSYETGWLVSVLAGWLLFPLAFNALAVPDFLAVIASDGIGTILRTVAFGALWGVGALCWALMVRYLGVGLGLAIGAGLCAAAGTLLPPVVTGNAVSLVATTGARVVLAGVVLSLAGIALVGFAGRLKEDEMSAEAKAKAVAEYNFKKGIITAVIAGFASAGINFALQGAPAWEAAAIASGAKAQWAGMPVLTVALWGGLAAQVVWVAVQHRRNASAGDYFRASRKRTLAANYALSASVGVIGVMQFVMQKVGEPLMGQMRYISFGVLMASAIFFSALVGFFLGEWKGTSKRTRACLGLGLFVLLAAFSLISAGGGIE
jgi:L-rhamnose-H+ transport protein